jgi:hypothetical protein
VDVKEKVRSCKNHAFVLAMHSSTMRTMLRGFPVQLSREKIEQMVQTFRTHGCAFDFDRKVCDAHVKDAIIQAKKQGGSVPVAGI